jgi:AcrR family transcriptional regulator
MAAKEKTPPELGRKKNFVAKNRAAILKAAQEVFAEFGPTATVEQIAAEAGVALSTLYMHFEGKEVLLQEVLASVFMDWEAWMGEAIKDVSDELDQLVIPMRLFVRSGESHPLYGNLVAKNFEFVLSILPIITSRIQAQVKDLVTSGVLDITDIPMRVEILTSILAFELRRQLTNPKAEISHADHAIEVALQIIGISASKAKKLVSGKLPV